MAKSSSGSRQTEMFRYTAVIPPGGLHWDDGLQPVDKWGSAISVEDLTQEEREFLQPPWLEAVREVRQHASACT